MRAAVWWWVPVLGCLGCEAAEQPSVGVDARTADAHAAADARTAEADAGAEADGSSIADVGRDASPYDFGGADARVADAGLADADAPGPDAGTGPYLTLAGEHNGWNPDDPGGRLAHQDGRYVGVVTLPAGPLAFKLAADGDWTVSYGAGDDRRHLPRSGPLRPEGGNLHAEVPVAGAWRVSMDPEPLRFEITFAGEATAEQRALLDAIAAGTVPDVASPVVAGEHAVFFHGGPAALGGSFNDWNPEADALVPTDGALHYAVRRLGQAVRHEYKLVEGDRWFSDPRNPHVAWDGIERPGVGDFNSVVWTAGYAPAGGRLERFRQASRAFGDERDVFVWLPPGYDPAPATPYPMLLVHDGNESLTRGRFDRALEAVVRAGEAPPLIAVFVALPTQDVRLSQYSFGPDSTGDRYADFLVEELLPAVETSYPVARDRALRGIIGASLGGLISYYAAWRHPGVWRLVGGQSSSFFWQDRALIATWRDGDRRDFRCYLDSGAPGDNADVTRAMAGALQARGYPLRHVEEAGAAHDWRFWEARFGGAVAWLFGD